MAGVTGPATEAVTPVRVPARKRQPSAMFTECSSGISPPAHGESVDEGRHVGIEVQEAHGAVRRVVVDGDLDWEHSLVLQESLQRLPMAGMRELVLDAGRLGFVDSGGLRALIVGRRIAEQAGAAFVIENPTAALHRLLELTGIDHLFLLVHGTPPAPRSGG